MLKLLVLWCASVHHNCRADPSNCVERFRAVEFCALRLRDEVPDRENDVRQVHHNRVKKGCDCRKGSRTSVHHDREGRGHDHLEQFTIRAIFFDISRFSLFSQFLSFAERVRRFEEGFHFNLVGK